jgi:positive regulator of sigma E activity
VVFEAEPSKVLFSAALIWILPLVAMFIGYLVADRYAKGFWPILSGFVFLFFSYGFLKLIDKKISGGKTFYPEITEIIQCPEKERGKNTM